MLQRHAHPAVAGNYLAGATLGAAISATMLFVLSGLVSPLPDTVRGVVFLVIVAGLALHLLGVVKLALPQRRYQIPRSTFQTYAPRGAFWFATELGLGFRTYIPAASPYGVAAAIVLVTDGDIGLGALSTAAAACGFGLGRARIVAANVFSRTVALEHPAGSLRSADAIALAMLALVGYRALAA